MTKNFPVLPSFKFVPATMGIVAVKQLQKMTKVKELSWVNMCSPFHTFTSLHLRAFQDKNLELVFNDYY